LGVGDADCIKAQLAPASIAISSSVGITRLKFCNVICRTARHYWLAKLQRRRLIQRLEYRAQGISNCIRPSAVCISSQRGTCEENEVDHSRGRHRCCRCNRRRSFGARARVPSVN
jgi:hypothetical protein